MRTWNWTAIPIACGIVVAAFVTYQIFRVVQYEHHYRTVCLASFSEPLNKEAIANSYFYRGHVKIAPGDIEIERFNGAHDGLTSYRYKTKDGAYFGLGVGHACGTEDVLPDDQDAWVREKFGS